MDYFGIASRDLGFGGQSLSDQVRSETEDERKKRMNLIRQNGMLGLSDNYAKMASMDLGLGGGYGI